MKAELLSERYDAWNIAPGADTVAHTPLVINAHVVVPLDTVTNASAAKNVLVYRCPRVRVVKLAGEVWAPGTKVYLKADATGFTTAAAAGANQICGKTADAALNGDVIGIIDLDPAQA